MLNHWAMEHVPDGATRPRKREVPPPQAAARPASLSLADALRTTGAMRDFTDQPVDDAVLAGSRAVFAANP